MESFNFKDLFCEILSGFCAIILTLLILDVFSVMDVTCNIEKIEKDLSFFTVLTVFSYLIGLIIDAIGLSLGEFFLDDWLVDSEAPKSRKFKIFFEKSSDNLVKYVETQWIYYSLYRNLLILSVLGLIFSIIKMVQLKSDLNIYCLTISAFIIIILSLYFSAKALIKLYYRYINE